MDINRPAQWFRLYAEFAFDPKVQMLSESDQRRFVMLLCLRCSNGDKALSDEEVAFSLRITVQEWTGTKSRLAAFLDSDNRPLAWERRQFQSNDSVERVRRYRQARKDSGLSVTGYDRHRDIVRDRDGGACVYCGESTGSMCIDHVLPVRLGGDDSPENLVYACKRCNSSKSGQLIENSGLSWSNGEAKLRYQEWLSRRRHATVTSQSRVEQSRVEQSRVETETEKAFGQPQAVTKSEKPKSPKPLPSGFDDFWSAYPRRVAKGQAIKAWAKISPDRALRESILRAVGIQSRSEKWRKEPEFIPYPATWLNSRRWEDEEIEIRKVRSW